MGGASACQPDDIDAMHGEQGRNLRRTGDLDQNFA